MSRVDYMCLLMYALLYKMGLSMLAVDGYVIIQNKVMLKVKLVHKLYVVSRGRRSRRGNSLHFFVCFVF